MTRVTSLTQWQSFIWLWRNDPEAKWFWFWCWIKRASLKEAVLDNYQIFGRTDGKPMHINSLSKEY